MKSLHELISLAQSQNDEPAVNTYREMLQEDMEQFKRLRFEHSNQSVSSYQTPVQTIDHRNQYQTDSGEMSVSSNILDSIIP